MKPQCNRSEVLPSASICGGWFRTTLPECRYPGFAISGKHPANVAEAFDDDVKFLAEIGIRSIGAALELPLYRAIFENCGFRYLSLTIRDGYPPTLEQACRLLEFASAAPRPLAVHCEGGIGRTATLLAVLLLGRGLSAAEAVKAVKKAMPPAFENPSQLEFVSAFERHLNK